MTEHDADCLIQISIHAPTRGATQDLLHQAHPGQNFNPRSHERSDFRKDRIGIIFRYFNPRSHERSDGLSG